MCDSYVYLLRKREGDAFKIGVSLAPLKRSATLPQEFDLAQSLQIPMAGGRAYKVETLLHYLFRDHWRKMPAGDGCTEWFNIEAWSDVVAFLAENRERLGVDHPQPVPLPVARPSMIQADPAAIEARRQALADRARIRAERLAMRLANCKDHNRRAVEQLEILVETLEANGAVRGILLGKGRQALMYLIFRHAGGIERFGEIERFEADYAKLPPLFSLDTWSTGSSIFQGYHSISKEGGRSIVALSVNTDFLTLHSDDELEQRLPSAARVRTLLLPYVAQVGERLGPQLMRLNRWMHAASMNRHEERAPVPFPEKW